MNAKEARELTYKGIAEEKKTLESLANKTLPSVMEYVFLTIETAALSGKSSVDMWLKERKGTGYVTYEHIPKYLKKPIIKEVKKILKSLGFKIRWEILCFGDLGVKW